MNSYDEISIPKKRKRIATKLTRISWKIESLQKYLGIFTYIIIVEKKTWLVKDPVTYARGD